MSINGMMRTSISGMEAQSVRLGAVSSNIANASTVGYKSAQTQFSTMLIDTPTGGFNSGGVDAETLYSISRQGVLTGTSSKYDIGVSGNGFFVVQGVSGQVALTRAGSFVPDGNGNLVNAAGFTLMGVPITNGTSATLAANGTAGLVPITLTQTKLEAAATTSGTLMVNVPSSSTAIDTGDLPSQNGSTSTSSVRTSLVVYGSLGEEITLDVHYAMTSTPGEWEVTVFNAADRSASGGFPYANGPISTSTLNFDSSGQLTTSPATVSIAVPGGETMDLDLGGTTQLATSFSVRSVNANGNPPDDNPAIEIGKDGIIYETYSNGARRAVWQIPLATVQSPDRMQAMSGNVFLPTSESGDLRLGAAGTAGFGTTISGALESSTVDLSGELTDMIEAQRNYTANSKVFQTGSELMEVLVNLKR